MQQRGSLYVVATPIGNRHDITLRALKILNKVGYVVCEHIPRTRTLLQFHDVDLSKTKFIKITDGNESQPTRRVLKILDSGADVALVSDAGTPLLSDPGFPLVREARASHITVTPIPGSSALTAIASVCPIPLNVFRFIGFISSNRRNYETKLREVIEQSVPTVFYVSPRDFQVVLARIVESGGADRNMFVGREITKLHESFWFDRCANIGTQLDETERQRGEFTCVIEGNQSARSVVSIEELVSRLIEADLRDTTIAKIVGKVSDMKRNDIYERIQSHKVRKSGVD